MPHPNRSHSAEAEQIERNLQEARLMAAADEMLRAVATAAVAWQGRRRNIRSKLSRISARPGRVRPARPRGPHRRARRDPWRSSKAAGYFKPESADVS
jgi:hypothetical protein